MEKMRWSKRSGILFLSAALICFVGATPAGAQNLAPQTQTERAGHAGDNHSGPSCVYGAGAQTLIAAACPDSIGAVTGDASGEREPLVPTPSRWNPDGIGTGRDRSGLGEGAWEQTLVFDGFMLGIAFGNGRNDDVVRLYSTQITANTVKEFTYDAGWSNTSNIALPFYSERSLEVGAGQNDGVMRVYAGEFNFSGGAREYTWAGEAWTGVAVGAAGQQLINSAFGPGRDDGVDRLYFSTGSAPPNNAAWEFSYTGTAWDAAPIPSPFGGVSDGTFGIALGDGRNDGSTRVYEGVFDAGPFQFYLYEFTWNGAGWDALEIAPIPSQIMGAAVGDGRNDGINRVYVVGRNFGIYEYTFDGSAWEQTATIPVGPETFDVAIGQGQNDGTNRLYTIRLNPGTVFEASFDGTAWNLATVGAPGGNLFHVRVGGVRGDALNRVYAGGNLGLFEYEHQ